MGRLDRPIFFNNKTSGWPASLGVRGICFVFSPIAINPWDGAIQRLPPPSKVSNQPKPVFRLGIQFFTRKAEQSNDLVADQPQSLNIGFRPHRSHRSASPSFNN